MAEQERNDRRTREEREEIMYCGCLYLICNSIKCIKTVVSKEILTLLNEIPQLSSAKSHRHLETFNRMSSSRFIKDRGSGFRGNSGTSSNLHRKGTVKKKKAKI